MVTIRGNGRTGASWDAVKSFPSTQTQCGAGSRPRTQPAQPGLLPLTGRDLWKDGIPIQHIRLPLNPQPRFATYWCPPQPSVRLGAGSPGVTGAQQGLGSGSEQPGDGSCLPCLSLSTDEETHPGWWVQKKMHQQQKNQDPINVNQREKDKK